MKFLRNADTGEIYSLTLEARDTLEEMAAQAPMTMDKLAREIEIIISTGAGAQDGVKAVEDYKRWLVIQLNAWAIEEREKDAVAWPKPPALLLEIAQRIEAGEL